MTSQSRESNYGESYSVLSSTTRKTGSYMVDDDSSEFDFRKTREPIESSLRRYSKALEEDSENISPIGRTSQLFSQADDFDNITARRSSYVTSKGLEGDADSLSSSRRSSRLLNRDDEFSALSSSRKASRLLSRDEDLDTISTTRIKRLSSRTGDDDLENISASRIKRLSSRDEDLEYISPSRRASRMLSREDDYDSSLPPRTKRLSSRVSEEGAETSLARLGKRFSNRFSEEDFEPVGSRKLVSRTSSREDETSSLSRYKRSDSRSSRVASIEELDASYKKTLEKIDSYKSQRSVDRDEDSSYILPSKKRTTEPKVSRYFEFFLYTKLACITTKV